MNSLFLKLKKSIQDQKDDSELLELELDEKLAEALTEVGKLELVKKNSFSEIESLKNDLCTDKTWLGLNGYCVNTGPARSDLHISFENDGAYPIEEIFFKKQYSKNKRSF